MFKKGQNIVYPMHGVGIVRGIVKNEFNGEEIEYYEIEFEDKEIKVFTPIRGADKIGLRELTSKKKIRDLLDNFTTKIKIDTKKPINVRFKERMSSGELNDALAFVAYVIRLKKSKNEEGKRLTVTEKGYYQKAIEFIRSELENVFEIGFLDKTNLI